MTQNHPKLIWNGYLAIASYPLVKIEAPKLTPTQTNWSWMDQTCPHLNWTDYWPQSQRLASRTSMSHLNWSEMDTWPLPSTHWSRLRPPNSRQTKQTGVEWVKLVLIWLGLAHWPQSKSLASGASMPHQNWSKIDTWPLPSTHWSRMRPPNSCQNKQTWVEGVKLVPIWIGLITDPRVKVWPLVHLCHT